MSEHWSPPHISGTVFLWWYRLVYTLVPCVVSTHIISNNAAIINIVHAILCTSRFLNGTHAQIQDCWVNKWMPKWAPLNFTIFGLPVAAYDYFLTHCINTDDNKHLMIAYYLPYIVLRALKSINAFTLPYKTGKIISIVHLRKIRPGGKNNLHSVNDIVSGRARIQNLLAWP